MHRARFGAGLMAQQLRQVIVSEATQISSRAQCLIDRSRSVDARQRHGRDHLRGHPRGAGGCGRDQPALGTWADGQERGLVWSAWPRCAAQWSFWWWTEVGRIVARLTWHGWFPA